MSDNRPSLSVPFIPELDNLSKDEIIRRLEEAGARRTIDCLNWEEQFPYRPLTTIAVAHSGNFIYIDFFVRCNYLRAVNFENNSSVHQDSCVEFFVCPDGNLPYYNFEFNCIGTAHAACRQDRIPPTADRRPARLNQTLPFLRNTTLPGTRRTLLVESPRCHPA